MSRCKRKATGWGLVWSIGRPESGSGNAQMREIDGNGRKWHHSNDFPGPMIWDYIFWRNHLGPGWSRPWARDKTSLVRGFQEHPFVRQKLLEYVQYLVREFDVDAFRLDTAIYMPKEFLSFGAGLVWFTCLKITPGVATRGMSKMFQRVFNFPPRKELQDAAGVDILGETTVNNISFLP